MRARPSLVSRVATPARGWSQRLVLALLFLLAIVLIAVDRAELPLTERLRTRTVDAFAPFLETVSRPVATATDWVEALDGLAAVQAENARLRAENERLQQWEAAARTLHAQNEALRSLLNAAPEIEGRHISARVIGDSGGSFVRSMILLGGEPQGIRKGLAVVNAEGLVGRVLDVGQRASRILLITDLNSRVPVLLEKSRERAILAGDNTDRPKLMYLPPGATVSPGDRVVTSGHGGAFPTGLPVGVVVAVEPSGVRVQPFVSWNRLEFVRVIDRPPLGIVGAGADASTARRGN